MKIGPNNKGLLQYLGNVSMKIHAKLGGITHRVPVASAVRLYLLALPSFSVQCIALIQ
jgi:hypothetical protein